jgi:uncharacterized membrane protein YoaK (UPF0700 family)
MMSKVPLGHAVTVLLLAITGGCVDAAIYLGFGVLTAAQTGNTIVLATSLAQGNLEIGLHAVVSVGAYVIGAAVGGIILLRRRGMEKSVSPSRWALAVELGVIVCLLVMWNAVGEGSAEILHAEVISLAATAMGIQSAVVLRLDTGPATTYITGTLTNFVIRLMRWLHLVEIGETHEAVQVQARSANLLSSDNPWFYGITWLVYLGVSVVTGLLFIRFGEFSLLVSIAALVTLLTITGNALQPNSAGTII